MSTPAASRLATLVVTLTALVATVLARGARAGAAEDLEQALLQPQAEARAHAARELSKLGPAAAPALEALRGAVADADPGVRYWAACALGRLGPAASAAVPELIALLQDTDVDARSAAAYALGQLGPGAAAAIPALQANARHGNEVTRSTAATALVQIGAAALPAILEALSSAELRDRLDMTSAVRGAFGLELDPRIPDTTPDDLAEIWARTFPAGAGEGVSRLRNGGFEEAGEGTPGWALLLEDGASGEALVDPARARDGSRSLRLARTNATGSLCLRSAEPIEVGPTENLTVRCFFQAENAPTNSALLLKFEDEQGNVFRGDLYYGATYQSQTLLRNTAPGFWDKRVAMFRGDGKPHRLRLRVILTGNPCTVWLDDITFPSAPYRVVHSSPVISLPLLGREDALARLAKRRNATAVVLPGRAGDGRVRLRVDGKQAVPVLYQTLNSQFADYAYFEQYGGVNLQAVPVPINDLWDARYPVNYPVWPAAGHTDFTTPFANLEQLARKAPGSYALLEFVVAWPADWVSTHPDQAWTNEQGERGYGTWMHMAGWAKELPAGQRWWPSPYSQQALADAGQVVRAFLAELRKTPYYRMVVGCIVTGGHDGQFWTGYPDYSAPGQDAFREWLRRKYATDAGLRDAWHQPQASLATAAVPPAARPPASTPYAVSFLDPLTETPWVDYQQCMHEQGVRLQEYFARTFKEAIGKPAIALTYSMGGGKGNNVYSAVLHSEVLDGIAPQPWYELRYPGYSGGLTGMPAAFNQHGKLLIKELDLRTWLRGGGDEMNDQRQAKAFNPEWFDAISRKEIGQMIAGHQGYWYFDIGSTAFRDRRLLESVRRCRDLAATVRRRRDAFRPDVVLVSAEQAGYWQSGASWPIGGPLALQQFQFQALKTSGVPYDEHYLEDVLAEPALQTYKVYIFEDAYRLTPEQRQRLDARLKRGGKTLVWLYAPGYVTPAGLSLEALSATVRMRTINSNVSAPPQCYAVASADPLAEGLPSLQGNAAMAKAMWRETDGPDAGADVQRFCIDDPRAVVLARYEDGRAAIGVMRLPDWTSVYLAAPGSLEGQLLHNIARQAGAYVATTPGPALEMNGSFLSLHGTRGGTYVVSLPRVCTVRDAIGGAVVAAHARQFTAQIEAQKTYWYLLE